MNSHRLSNRVLQIFVSTLNLNIKHSKQTLGESDAEILNFNFLLFIFSLSKKLIESQFLINSFSHRCPFATSLCKKNLRRLHSTSTQSYSTLRTQQHKVVQLFRECFRNSNCEIGINFKLFMPNQHRQSAVDRAIYTLKKQFWLVLPRDVRYFD